MDRRRPIMTTRSAKATENQLKNKRKEVQFKEPVEESESSEEETEIQLPAKKGFPPPKNKKKANIPTELPEKEMPVSESESTNKDSTPELPYIDVPPLTTVVRPNGTSVPTQSFEKEKEKPGPAYKTQAPIESEADYERVFKEMLDLTMPVTLRGLIGGSPNLRDFLKKSLTKVRTPVLLEEIEDEESPTQKQLPKAIPLGPKEIETGLTVDELPVAAFLMASDIRADDRMEPTWKVASDPYLQFALSNDGAIPKEPYVARESGNLRVIFPKINGVFQEEAILDSGSQIVSMAEATAVEMGLTWNPAITINMQSANKTVDRTLGLAENVAFRFGGVTIYLQVHIIKAPAYKVLLGQPFNQLTTSVVTTESDGSTTVLVTDPNTQQKALLPTYARGLGPGDLLKVKQAQSF